MERIPRTSQEYPGVIIAHGTRVREDLMTFHGESWSWQRHAKEHLLHHGGHFRTLRRVIVMVTGALDEGRIGGFERHHAMFCQICGMLESAKDSGHDLTWIWPLLGLSETAKQQLMAPRWKGAAQGQEQAPFQRRRQFTKADSCCG